MLNRRAALIVAAVFVFSLSRLSTAQDSKPAAPPAPKPSAAPADPIAQQVGAAMDRVAAETPAQTAPGLRGGSVVSGDRMLRTIFALCVVVALILIAYWGVARWGKRVPMLAGAHLGKVLGRLYLDRSTALHFVQVGEKVLLIGANANSISLIGEFAAGAVNGRARAASPEPTPATPFNPDSFLAELRARSQELAGAERLPRAEEDEIANLRGDIQRLQRYLREENREPED